jgi:hypothetical protein
VTVQGLVDWVRDKGEDIEESLNKLIEALIIDFNLNTQEQETSETFLTTFRPFTNDQAFNIITVLADRSFTHLIIPENLSVSTPIRPVTDVTDCKQDPFIYIIIERYTSKEFYGIIIDIDTFKKFTTDYKQYLIYKNTIINNININTIQIGAINV